MAIYRCDWCGRFYSSPLPEGSACPNHVPESNARNAASIARHNARIVPAQARGESEAPAAVDPHVADPGTLTPRDKDSCEV